MKRCLFILLLSSLVLISQPAKAQIASDGPWAMESRAVGDPGTDVGPAFEYDLYPLSGGIAASYASRFGFSYFVDSFLRRFNLKNVSFTQQTDSSYGWSFVEDPNLSAGAGFAIRGVNQNEAVVTGTYSIQNDSVEPVNLEITPYFFPRVSRDGIEDYTFLYGWDTSHLEVHCYGFRGDRLDLVKFHVFSANSSLANFQISESSELQNTLWPSKYVPLSYGSFDPLTGNAGIAASGAYNLGPFQSASLDYRVEVFVDIPY